MEHMGMDFGWFSCQIPVNKPPNVLSHAVSSTNMSSAKSKVRRQETARQLMVINNQEGIDILRTNRACITRYQKPYWIIDNLKSSIPILDTGSQDLLCNG